MIPYTQHTVTPDDEAAVLRALRSGYLTQGPEVEALEIEFSAYCGAKYAVAVSSGTAALHVAYLACGVEPDTTVLVPANTFVATANAALRCGAHVQFLDVGRERGVWQWHPGDPWPVVDLQVPVSVGGSGTAWCPTQTTVVDFCHGPYVLPDDPTNTLAAACFSLHPAKHVAAGEGGIILTNNQSMALAVRWLRNHGRCALGDRRMVFLGMNYRLDELSAALARSQLARLDEAIAIRRRLADRYDGAFQDEDVTPVPHSSRSARHLYQVQVPDARSFRTRLAERGIGTQIHYRPVPIEPYYRTRFGYRLGQFPNAEWWAAHTVSIPLYPGLTEAEQDRVIAAVQEAVCVSS